MSDPQPPQGGDPDPTADTAAFQRFVASDRDAGLPTERGKAVGVPFRIITLLLGLVVAAGLIWWLLTG